MQGQQEINILSDLHMAHLNCKLKRYDKNLGSNVTPKIVQRAAKGFGSDNQIYSKFKEETRVRINKQFQFCPSFDSNLFQRYTAFSKHKPLLLDINQDKITEQIE